MTDPSISIKHFGYTIEFQVEDKIIYINPFEKNDDRKPENADIIVSFIRAGVNDLHMKNDLSCHMNGLKCYGSSKSSYLVCELMRNHWRGMEYDAGQSGYPGKDKMRAIDGNIIEFDDRMIGTDLLRNDDSVHGVGLSVDGTEFHYFHVDDKYVDDFLDHTSSCAILVIDNWQASRAAVRKILLADQSDYFYLACGSLRKNDLKEFTEFIPKPIVDKIICKKSKWTYS